MVSHFNAVAAYLLHFLDTVLNSNKARDGQFPGRIAFGGNLVRDAVQTEPV